MDLSWAAPKATLVTKGEGEGEGEGEDEGGTIHFTNVGTNVGTYNVTTGYRKFYNTNIYVNFTILTFT